MSNLDAVFYLSIGAMVASIIGLCIRYSYKIRCSDVDIGFGCIHVHRDLEVEERVNQRSTSAVSNIPSPNFTINRV